MVLPSKYPETHRRFNYPFKSQIMKKKCLMNQNTHIIGNYREIKIIKYVNTMEL